VADLPPERLLTRRQTAELIGTSERTLRRWEEQNKGPPALCFSKRMTRYNIEAVREWLDIINVRAARREKLYSTTKEESHL
jgi:predicted DNA-binding transcriptional regulator AlpA